MADLAQIAFRADTSELREAKASLEALGPAANKAETAVENLDTAIEQTAVSANSASAANTKLSAAAEAAAGAYGRGANTARMYAAANANVATTANAAAAANNNLAGQTGNIAAQFNDIGVQLAGGQSPFLIALQQGTQLNQIFGGQGLGAILRGLGGAFASLINPVSLLTIAVITFGGAAIQALTSWLSSSEEVNLSLEEQAQLISAVTEEWGNAFPAIQAYNNELERQKQIQDLIAAGGITNEQQLEKVRGKFEEIAGWTADFSKAIDEIQIGKLNTLQSEFNTLSEKVAAGTATQQDFNNVLTAAEDASAAGVSGLERFISVLGSIVAAVQAPLAAVNQLNAAISAAGNAALNNPANWRSRGMTGQSADGPIQSSNPDFLNLPDNGPVPGGRGTPELSGFPWENFGKSGRSGGGGGGAKAVKTELEMIREGFSKLSEPFNQAKSAYTTLKQAMDNGIITNDQYAESLGVIQQAFIAAGGTSQQWATITTESSKKVQDATKFTADLVKGFASDFRSALANGESVFEAFGNAMMNVADKLIDRGLNALIDKFFEVGDAASSVGGAIGGSGGGGGIAGWISKGLSWLFSANGNVFNKGWTGFAKGGSFTNKVVNKPTAFSFADGTQLGEMGEAGPEAIMPLKRGPNGSLGVQIHGGKQQAQPVSNSVAVENNYTIAGAVSEEKIVSQIRASAEQTMNETKQKLTSWLSEYQTNGIMSTT